MILNFSTILMQFLTAIIVEYNNLYSNNRKSFL